MRRSHVGSYRGRAVDKAASAFATLAMVLERFGVGCGGAMSAVTETVAMPASTGSFRRAGHQRLRAEPTSADDTLLDSAGPTQRESEVQFSMPDRVSGLSGNAPESDLLDDSDPDDDPHQVSVEQHAEHPRRRLVLVGGVQGRGRDVVSSQATVADSAPDVVDALELDLGEVEEPPRQPFVVPMTDSEGTSGSSSDTEAKDVEEVQVGPRLREAFRSLDGVDVGHLFSMRAVLMKSPPAFVKGAYWAGLRVALREILQGREHSDDARSARGWKLLLLLPRMLLFRPPRGGLIPKQRLLDRF